MNVQIEDRYEEAVTELALADVAKGQGCRGTPAYSQLIGLLPPNDGQFAAAVS